MLRRLYKTADQVGMEADALRMRITRPFVFTNWKTGIGVDLIASFVTEKGGLADALGSWCNQMI